MKKILIALIYVIVYVFNTVAQPQVIDNDLLVTKSLKPKFIPVQSYTDNCFAGHQDNFLAFADKKFTVTQQGPAPGSGTISCAFDVSHQDVRWYVDSQVVIEINVGQIHYLRALGINFNYGRWARNILIEGYYTTDNRWISFLNVTNNNGNVVADIGNQSYLSKLRFTFSGIVNGHIALEEIWGYSAYTSSKDIGAFLRKDGGAIYGDLQVNGTAKTNNLVLNNSYFVNVAKFKAETFGQVFENGINKYQIKIKTNLPFLDSCQMTYVIIEGYDFEPANTIGLGLVWYIYKNNFVRVKGSSWGSSIPKVTLAVESGKVVILLKKEADKRWYYSRFTVHAEQSMTQNPDWFKNWSFAAEPINGTKITAVNFDNSFGTGNFSGNVSIGKSAIPADLTVNGSINCTTPNATVTASAFKVGDWVIKEKNVPDYVFKEDYQLKPLNEVEKFTRENHHLPDVPSASQMKKEGVDLVEMNMTLLKKVEELTLYMIEQNKKIKNQQNEINELKSVLKCDYKENGYKR